MNTFGKQTYRLLDKTKPYQRRKLSHRRLATRTATAELTAPTAVGSGDLILHGLITQIIIIPAKPRKKNSAPTAPNPSRETKLPGLSRRLNTTHTSPNTKTKPPIKLKAPDEPSAAKANKHAPINTGNEAINRNLRNLTTPMIKSEMAATNGND